MLLKNHLDMIGRNEPVQRKARFWQSYVRALKGTDDMRAPDRIHRPRGIFRPLLADFPELASSWPLSKSIYDTPSAPADRISVPGYRYLPVSRETYGYSPRNLYPSLPYTAADRYRPESWIDPRAWRDRLERLDRLGPAGSYWLSPLRGGRSISPAPRATSLPPMDLPLRASSVPPLRRAISPPPLRRAISPLPDAPSEKAVGFNYAGQPIYSRGGLTRRPLSELLEPSVALPMSRITRDPWWWEYPELRPFVSPWNLPSHAPYYLRDSYLSPIKRSYLWSKHPVRPFGMWWDAELGRHLDGRLLRSPNAPSLPMYTHRFYNVHPTLRDLSPHMKAWQQLSVAVTRVTGLRQLERTEGRVERLRLTRLPLRGRRAASVL